MNKHTAEMLGRLQALGITWRDAIALRRIAMTLHRWHELECGDGYSYVERDEDTGKVSMVHQDSGRKWPMPDRETGALRRLAVIMAEYPDLIAYVQTDPRGAALYILRSDDVPANTTIDCCYSRGVAVFK